MVNGTFNLGAGPLDLGLERADAFLELGDGQAIEILALERGQRIVGPGPKDIVQVHMGYVDRPPAQVNKPPEIR